MMPSTNDLRDDVARLSQRLRERKENARLLYNYYDGNHPIPWAHKKVSRRYRALIDQAINNFPLLIVDSLNDRLRVDGFRLDSEDADMSVWQDVWQANNLDLYAPQVQLQSLITGISYMSTWPTEDGQPGSVVRPESCFEVMHELDPGDPYVVRRALKVWPNRFDGKWYGRYFADGAYVRLEAKLDTKAPGYGVEYLDDPAKWEIIEELDNPLGDESPYTPFVNRPGIDGIGRGEYEDAISTINRINLLTVQMLLAGEFSAFKIRYATGIEIPTDDQGNEIEPFDVAMDRLWVSENESAKFGTMDGTDLKPYLDAITQAIQHLAAITRTPAQALLGSLTNLSAEALKATESGQVKKAEQRQLSFGESYEAVIRKALRVADDPRADLPDIETIWRDPENKSESQHVDALSKLYVMGVPQKAIWELFGASPQQIERWDAMRSEDVFNRIMLSQATKPPGLDQQQGQSGPQGGGPEAQLQQSPDTSTPQ